MIAVTPRTTLGRRAARGSHDESVIHAILDEALICHVGYVDGGQPFVIPTLHARIGDGLYLHGSVQSRMLLALRAGAPACVTVTLMDGLVLARSAMHHSMNYRSVVVLGTAAEVTDREHKLRVLDAMVEHVARGRSREIRGPDEAEAEGHRRGPASPSPRPPRRSAPGRRWTWRRTTPCRTGPAWSRLRLQPLPPQPDPRLRDGTPVSDAVGRLAGAGR